MTTAARLLRYWPDAAYLRRGIVYALSFLALAGTGWLTGEHGYLWSATASIWTCLADRQGTAAARMRALGTVSIGGALASALGACLSGSPLLALLVVLAAGLAAGLVELRGPQPLCASSCSASSLIAACLRAHRRACRLLRTPGQAVSTTCWAGSLPALVSLLLIPSQRDTRPRTEGNRGLRRPAALCRFPGDYLACPRRQRRTSRKSAFASRPRAASAPPGAACRTRWACSTTPTPWRWPMPSSHC